MSNGNGQASLEETIKKNAEARNADLINNLEEKYGDKSKAEVAKKGSRGRPKKAASEEPKISEVADKPTVEVKSDVEETSAQAEVPAKKGRGRPGKKAVEDKVEEAIEPRSSEEPTTVETTASAAVEPTEDKQDPIEIEVDNNPATAPPKKAGRPPKGAKKVEKTTEDKSDADSDVAAGRKTRGVLGSPKKAAESESDEPEVPAKRGRPARGAATAAKELMKTAAADEAAEEKPGRKTRGAAGSPKKSAEAEKPEEAVVPAKKGRGRPPAAAKHQEESADEGTSVEAEPKEKGKRGRPKKQ